MAFFYSKSAICPQWGPVWPSWRFDRGFCPTINVVWFNYTLNAAIKGAIPMILRTRLKLQARTCRLISAATFSRVLVRKWVYPNPIQAFNVP
ncbi:MAG: hypothetical protein ACI8Q6_003197, partial [Granulosicoccus sp.]